MPLSADAISAALDEASEVDNDGDFPAGLDGAVQPPPEMVQDGLGDLVSRFESKEAEDGGQGPRSNGSLKRRMPATREELEKCAKHPFAERINQMFNAHVIDARVRHDETTS